jgi:hypothetical protein
MEEEVGWVEFLLGYFGFASGIEGDETGEVFIDCV